MSVYVLSLTVPVLIAAAWLAGLWWLTDGFTWSGD